MLPIQAIPLAIISADRLRNMTFAPVLCVPGKLGGEFTHHAFGFAKLYPEVRIFFYFIISSAFIIVASGESIYILIVSNILAIRSFNTSSKRAVLYTL